MSNILPIQRTKDQARRNYDRISSIYDWITVSEKQFIQQGIELLSPQPGDSILEIGSGTGSALRMIAELAPSASCLVGLDLSRKMLTRSINRTIGTNSPTAHIQGDATHLPFRSLQFNRVFCSFTLELFPIQEIHLVLQEIFRVINPDGQLVLISLAQHPRTLAVKLYEIAHRIFPVLIDCRPIPLVDLLEAHNFKILNAAREMNFGLPIWITSAEPL